MYKEEINMQNLKTNMKLNLLLIYKSFDDHGARKSSFVIRLLNVSNK